MNILRRALVLSFLVVATSSLSSAQITVGKPTYGSFGGGPFDTIDLANNNVHFEIPVLTKPGRGINFSYSLGYDSSVWFPVGVSGSQSWQPVQNWGWLAQTNAATGYLAYSASLVQVPCGYPPQLYYGELFSNYVYVDAFGVSHPFPGAEFFSGACLSGGKGAVATDGSGYSFAMGCLSSTGVCDKAGRGINAPQNSTSGAGSMMDTNGNYISVSTSGVFTDTLGLTVLTPGGSGTPSSPKTFTYTDPNGNSQKYTMNYTNFTVWTNFGASGISEYHSSGPIPLVTSVVLPDGSQYLFTYEATPSTPTAGACTPFAGTTCVTARLQSVTLPTGATVTYNYTGGNNGILPDGSAATLVRYTPDSGSNCWTYARSENGSAWTTTTTDPQGNQTVMSFQGIYATELQVYQGSVSPSNLMETLYACYNGAQVPCNSTAITLPITEIENLNVWASTNQDSGNITYFDSTGYGLVQKADEYAYGNGNLGALVRETKITYASLGNGIVADPASVQVCSGACNGSNTVGEATYTYDGGTPASSGITTQHSSVSGSRGNLTTLTQYISSSATISQNFSYWDTGKVYVAYDAKNNPTTYQYSSTYAGAYLTEMTNALNQSEYFTYDPNTGLVTSLKDANSQTTTYSYDLMLRPSLANYPDGGESQFEYAFQYGGSYVEAQDKIDSTRWKYSYLWLDGLGRPARAAVTNGEAQPYDEIENTCFDSDGRISLQGYPFQDNGWSGPISCSVKGDTYAYDALGRAKEVLHSDGSAALASFSGNCATAADEQGKARQVCTDAQGRITSVTEDPGNSPHLNYTTTYTYDLLNDLTGVTQNGSRSRSFTYDWLSRLTSATNPESGMTCYGTLSGGACQHNGYDADGNLIYRTDARGILTTYAYDALSRLTQKTYSDGTPTANYLYDQSSGWSATQTNLTGRLSEAWTSLSGKTVAAQIFSFDPNGRINLNNQYTPATNAYHSISYAYDFLGDMTSAANGEGVTFSGTYNLGGRLTQMTSSLSDSQHPATLVSGVHYNAAGASVSSALGNGLTQTSAFNGLLQPCRINVNSSGTLLTTCGQSVPTGNVLDLTLGFSYGSGDNGNVASFAAVGAQNFNRSYTYDVLNRIATMSAPGDTCSGLSWTIDAWGNRTAQSATGGTCNTFSASVGTNNQLTGSPYQYDAAGNMTHDASHSYFYDAENRLIQADGSAGYCATGSGTAATACYAYDAFDLRASKKIGSTTTSYLRDLNGRVIAEDNGGWAAGYVYRGGQLLAEYFNSTTYFAHTDHLGSTRLLTGYPTASVAECDDYYPFGEQIACGGTSTTSHKFTGYQVDSETNLDNANARYYGSSLGRFMSPDPLGIFVADATNPQSWNLYSYAYNNPLAFVDPSGMDDCDPSDPSCGSGGPGGCDPNDPSCGSGGPGGCDPSDPSCGGGPPDPCAGNTRGDCSPWPDGAGDNCLTNPLLPNCRPTLPPPPPPLPDPNACDMSNLLCQINFQQYLRYMNALQALQQPPTYAQYMQSLHAAGVIANHDMNCIGHAMAGMIPFVGHLVPNPSTPIDGTSSALGYAGEAQIVLSATGKLPTVENLLGKLGPAGGIVGGINAGLQANACFDQHP
ncbi:MAG TPA: RHS repeat-associated core domain-containing protein [Candidatus Acidoferrales bacterium]|nr:RHS repeat-associated core domain-containing protein [Candidatus Acidoferrales bacterium]